LFAFKPCQNNHASVFRCKRSLAYLTSLLGDRY